MKLIRPVLCLTCFFIVANTLCFAQKPIIVVVKSADISPYNSALEGFKKIIKNRKPKLINFNVKNKDLIKQINENNPEMVLTIGTAATRVIKQNVKDIPVVFCMVLSPVENDFIRSTLSSGNNLTGVQLDIPVESKFKTLKTILPEIKDIGLIYTVKENRNLVSKGEYAAKKLGLNLRKLSIENVKQFPKAFEELIKSIDAFWMIANTSVYTSETVQEILLRAIRNKVPVIGLSPPYVKAGALFSLSCDYEDIGKQAGEIGMKVLSGNAPGNIPISSPRKEIISLNLIVAERIGIEIPEKVINKAENIYK
ncbi:MAG: ABC transporter substrate-binding protein [Elusimicrobiota bacterium]